MPGILTKTDISFNDVQIQRQFDYLKQEYFWSFTCNYDVITAEGEIIHREFWAELSPAQRTRVIEFFSGLRDQIKAKEGVA